MLTLKAGLRSWINNFSYYCYGACFTRQVCPCRKFLSHHQVAVSRLQGLFGGSLLIPETLFLELNAANSIPAFMFHRYSSSLFGIVPSALIITGTPFTLFIFHNSHSRSKNKFNVLILAIECGFPFIVISSECDRGRTLFCNFLLLLPKHQIRKESISL